MISVAAELSQGSRDKWRLIAVLILAISDSDNETVAVAAIVVIVESQIHGWASSLDTGSAILVGRLLLIGWLKTLLVWQEKCRMHGYAGHTSRKVSWWNGCCEVFLGPQALFQPGSNQSFLVLFCLCKPRNFCAEIEREWSRRRRRIWTQKKEKEKREEKR